MVQGVSEEKKLEEATRYDKNNYQAMKKMEELQAEIKNSKPKITSNIEAEN